MKRVEYPWKILHLIISEREGGHIPHEGPSEARRVATIVRTHVITVCGVTNFHSVVLWFSMVVSVMTRPVDVTYLLSQANSLNERRKRV